MYLLYISLNVLCWGGEDDDLYNRAISKFGKVIKLPSDTARFFMLDHFQDTPNPKRYGMIE